MEIKAVFLGYQETLREPYPMYNIEGGEYDRSTVSGMRLKELGIKIPYTPEFVDWVLMTNETYLIQKYLAERRMNHGN